MDISALIDSLHPLEIKVLTALGSRPPGTVLGSEALAAAAELEPSQLSMAIEWLLAKSLIAVHAETVTPIVSLTKVGEQYGATASPIERIFAAARARKRPVAPRISTGTPCRPDARKTIAENRQFILLAI